MSAVVNPRKNKAIIIGVIGFIILWSVSILFGVIIILAAVIYYKSWKPPGPPAYTYTPSAYVPPPPPPPAYQQLAVCPSCGATSPPNSRFCPSCGARIT
ncbi:MAG: zinc-ribbon domain-containing protein [Candidatus Geothermarchaeales archaeon]